MLEVKPLRRRPRPTLGELLVQQGAIDPDELEVALERQARVGGTLGGVLVDLGLVSSRLLMQALSSQLSIPALDLESTRIAPDVTRWVDVSVAERFRVFPVAAEPRQALLRVATADPQNVEALETLTAHSGMMVFFFLCDERTIVRTIDRYYRRAAPPPPQLDLRVAELEHVMREQGQAIRAMVELLDRRGLMRREALLDRLAPQNTLPPPLPLKRAGPRRLLWHIRDDA
jgi:hypothetical protein